MRKAYVNEIKITEGEQQTSIEQQMLTGAADLSWDLGPTPTQANQLINQNNPLINVQSEIASNPYIIFNTQSPNNGGALGKVAVRQALSTPSSARPDPGRRWPEAGGAVDPRAADAARRADEPPHRYYPYDPTKAKRC